MVDLLVLFLFLIAGSLIGWVSIDFLPSNLLEQVLLQESYLEHLISISDIKNLFGGLGALLALLIGLIIQQLRKRLGERIKNTPSYLLFSRSIGLILGLILANLLLAPILLLPIPEEIIIIKPAIAVIINIFFGLLGYNLAEVHGRTILRLFNPNSTEALLITEGILTPVSPKILDTSVIIDGRINALLECGFIEGQVIAAQSVVDELQILSDSSNNEKRLKGRRGLKILNQLSAKYGRRIILDDTRYEGEGTDSRLLQLTEEIGGTLITSDYNLSEIAKIKELKVLNLSELVIALRADVQPGETLQIKVVREGKEANQGVGYLDDGTMVVIEEAKQALNQRVDVLITGALQTPTGRMIFGRLGKAEPPNKSNKMKAK